MSHLVKVKLIEILPCAKYMNKVYNQEVIVRTETGHTLRLFDDVMCAKKEQKNKRVLVKLGTMGVFSQTTTKVTELIPATSSFQATFVGKIISVRKKPRADFDERYETIVESERVLFRELGKKIGDIGEFVRFTGRLDLLEVKTLDS